MTVKEEEDISYRGQSRNYESRDGGMERWRVAGHDGEETKWDGSKARGLEAELSQHVWIFQLYILNTVLLAAFPIQY